MSVPQYESSENESDSDDEVVAKKARGNIQWEPFKDFLNEDEKNVFFADFPNWIKFRTHHVDNGINNYYYCNVNGTTLGKKCPAQLRLFQLYDSVNLLLLKEGDHNHDEDVVRPVQLLEPAAAKKIDELHKIGYTMRLISNAIRNDDEIIKKPTRNQASRILCVQKLKK